MRFVMNAGLILLGVGLGPWANLLAETPAEVVEAVRAYRTTHQHEIMQELVGFLAIPNVAADTPNIQRSAAKLRAMLEARGLEVQLLPIAGRGPVVFGEQKSPGATRTVIFYSHYDGQPVDPSR